MGPKPNYVLSKIRFFGLFIGSWYSYTYMYVGKSCNANPTSTYPPCYALDISTKLLKLVECVVLALDLQCGMCIAVTCHV